jgi:hypothetical protein
MIIKLPIPFIYARHKEAKVAQPLTQVERIKADRLVMMMLFVIAIIGGILFA